MFNFRQYNTYLYYSILMLFLKLRRLQVILVFTHQKIKYSQVHQIKQSTSRIVWWLSSNFVTIQVVNLPVCFFALVVRSSEIIEVLLITDLTSSHKTVPNFIFSQKTYPPFRNNNINDPLEKNPCIWGGFLDPTLLQTRNKDKNWNGVTRVVLKRKRSRI